jgi:hypothetical protein
MTPSLKHKGLTLIAVERDSREALETLALWLWNEAVCFEDKMVSNYIKTSCDGHEKKISNVEKYLKGENKAGVVFLEK